MYFTARHKDIKLNQDYSDFTENSLIICDGIGSLINSGEVAKKVTEVMIDNRFNSIDKLILNKEIVSLKNSKIQGGTTILFAQQHSPNSIRIEYLGNGGIIHLQGNFAENVNTDIPYRYAELMLPHITPKGELDKHLSNSSEKQDYSVTKMSLSLNQKSGDIVLFFTDGISSLEDKVILKDNDGRYWRNENQSIQLLLKEFDIFLKSTPKKDFKEELIKFNEKILEKLKYEKYLEDDAALGIIITNEALNYYKSENND